MGRRELTTDDEPTDALWHELLHQFSSYFFRDTSNYYKTVVLDHGGQVESRRTVDELLAHFQFTLTHLFVMSPEPYRPAAGIDKLLGAVNGHLKRHHQWNDAEIRQSIRDGQVLKTSLLHLLQHHSVFTVLVHGSPYLFNWSEVASAYVVQQFLKSGYGSGGYTGCSTCPHRQVVY